MKQFFKYTLLSILGTMGILGAVLATGASPIVGILLMSSHWRKKRNSFRIIKEKICFSVVKQNILLGFPSLIVQVASGLTMIIFNFLILKIEGNTGVAAYGVGKKKEIKDLYKYAMLMMIVLSVVLYVLIFVFASPVASIFNSEQNMRMQDFTSTERVLPAHILTLLRGIVLIVPLSFLMAKMWEMNGIWVSFPVTELIVAVIGWVLYQKRD